jgi:hypothetical protein
VHSQRLINVCPDALLDDGLLDLTLLLPKFGSTLSEQVRCHRRGWLSSYWCRCLTAATSAELNLPCCGPRCPLPTGCCAGV